MTAVAVFVKLTAHPGKGDALVDALGTMFDVALAEPRTPVYAIHRVHEEPDVVWVYELHTSVEALEANAGHEAAIAIGPRMLDLLAEQPQLVFTRPERAKGLPLEGA